MNGSWCGKLWLNIQLQVKCWQDSWNSMNQMKSPMIVEVILESLQSSGQIGLSGGSWPLQQVLQWMSQPYWRQQTTLLSVILMCIHMPLLFRYDSPEKVREKKVRNWELHLTWQEIDGEHLVKVAFLWQKLQKMRLEETAGKREFGFVCRGRNVGI